MPDEAPARLEQPLLKTRERPAEMIQRRITAFTARSLPIRRTRQHGRTGRVRRSPMFQFHQPSRASPRRRESARRSSTFTVGHVSGSQCVVRIERISSSNRMKGRKNGWFTTLSPLSRRPPTLLVAPPPTGSALGPYPPLPTADSRHGRHKRRRSNVPSRGHRG